MPRMGPPSTLRADRRRACLKGGWRSKPLLTRNRSLLVSARRLALVTRGFPYCCSPAKVSLERVSLSLALRRTRRCPGLTRASGKRCRRLPMMEIYARTLLCLLLLLLLLWLLLLLRWLLVLRRCGRRLAKGVGSLTWKRCWLTRLHHAGVQAG